MSDTNTSPEKPPVRHNDLFLVVLVAVAVGMVIWNEKRSKSA